MTNSIPAVGDWVQDSEGRKGAIQSYGYEPVPGPVYRCSRRFALHQQVTWVLLYGNGSSFMFPTWVRLSDCLAIDAPSLNRKAR